MKLLGYVLVILGLLTLFTYLVWPPFVIRTVENLLPAARIEYVVENGFHGIIRLRLYSRSGVSSIPLLRRVVLPIPFNGMLDITGGDPMAKMNRPEAHFRDGRVIPFDDPNDNTPRPLVLIDLGRYENGKEAWYFLGSRAEADELYQKISSKRAN